MRTYRLPQPLLFEEARRQMRRAQRNVLRANKLVEECNALVVRHRPAFTTP